MSTKNSVTSYLTDHFLLVDLLQRAPHYVIFKAKSRLLSKQVKNKPAALEGQPKRIR